MKQVDLETLVSACAGGGGGVDRKIACETLAGGEKPPDEDNPSTELLPDFPPESFWLSKDAEYDWFDRNAFLDRKESTKGNSNFYSNVFPFSNSSSQRFSSNLKSKTGIIGLPKTQKTSFVDPSNRRICKHANVSLFPKRSESMAKSAVTEPSSPNVSCIGRVRSKKGRRRRSKDKNKDKDITNAAANQVVEKSRSTGKYQKKKKKKGIYMRIFGIFRSERKQKKEVAVAQSKEEETPRTSSAVDEISSTSEPSAAAAAVISDPPGLGGMKRFTSGRRSTSSVDEIQ